MSIDSLKPGAELSNQQLCEVFGCSPQGGMRRSLSSNTLVLISNHVSSVYHDRWIGNVLHYTGMGQSGDQRLDATQNKTLAESRSNGVGVHLFEVHVEGTYTYVGKMRLNKEPYQEQQLDADDKARNVWVFPLVVEIGEVPTIEQATLAQQVERVARQVRRLTDDEVRRRAERARTVPGQRSTVSKQFDRDPHVAEHAKRVAKGICDLCSSPAPFRNGDGQPYLETHHIEWLAKGGSDTIDNTVALCPNCHRKMHVLNLETDREKLFKRVTSRRS